jgi:hypothetical protein
LLASGEEWEAEGGDCKPPEMREVSAVRIGCKLHGAAPLFFSRDLISNILLAVEPESGSSPSDFIAA